VEEEQARGEVIVVRYADDFIVGFQHRIDAERFLVELRDRLAKFCLELHPGKTRLIEFGRFALRDRQRRGEVGSPETFNFLGFTHICACNRKAGRYQVQRRTMRKRMTAKLHEVKTEMQRRRELPIADQGRWLAAVLRGHLGTTAFPPTTKPSKHSEAPWSGTWVPLAAATQAKRSGRTGIG